MTYYFWTVFWRLSDWRRLVIAVAVITSWVMGDQLAITATSNRVATEQRTQKIEVVRTDMAGRFAEVYAQLKRGGLHGSTKD